MKSTVPFIFSFVASIWVLFSFSCKKNNPITPGNQLHFSVDTLFFDTVFTAQGSSTRFVKIYNNDNQKIELSNIRLEKGALSPYRLNVNGSPGKEFQKVEIAAKDSLWIFVAVTIDPTQEDNPFFVEDKLIAQSGGKNLSLPIISYGQNANYIVDSVLQTQTWTPEKPYVIMKNALVDAQATLTIQAGTRVYVHQDSRLFVQGSLKILGNLDEKVIFQGDRLDRDVYVGEGGGDVPGEWGGLYFFKESTNNLIEHAIFKNGGASTRLFDNTVLAATIQVDKDENFNPSSPKLTIKNSTIYNSQGYGIVAFNSSIKAENCLVVQCGAENIMLFEGGNYDFTHCTIATYGSYFLKHDKNTSMAILNFLPISQNEYTGASLNTQIKNCIIYGSLPNELMIQNKEDYPSSVQIKNTLFKNKDGIANFVSLENTIVNQDPLFQKIDSLNFRLSSGSPAIGAGSVLSGSLKDLDGKNWLNPPSIGCYEFSE